MRLHPALLAAGLLAAALPLSAQTPTTPAAPPPAAPRQPPAPAPGSAEMFAYLAGRWSCEGAFANGNRLAADLSWTPRLGGRWLELHHADRAPGRFEATAQWGTDPATGTMVSVMFDIGGGVRLFTAPEGWTNRTVVFETHELLAPPRGRERFTWRAESDTTLRMTWEVNRNGNWVMGDWLLCTKQGDARL
jgi:hypothetical protein